MGVVFKFLLLLFIERWQGWDMSKCWHCGKPTLMFTVFCSGECAKNYKPVRDEDKERERKDLEQDILSNRQPNNQPRWR